VPVVGCPSQPAAYPVADTMRRRAGAEVPSDALLGASHRHEWDRTDVSAAAHRIAYLSLQAVVDGQDTWAAVTEVIKGWEAEGWAVDRYFPDYPAGGSPSLTRRLLEMWRVQGRLAARTSQYDAVYVRAHQMALPTARRAARLGIPVIQESNGPYEDLYVAYPRLRFARRVFDAMQRWQYRHAAAIISVAEGLTAWIKSESGHDRVVTIGNGANTQVFSPDASRRPGLPEHFAVFFGQFPAWQGIGTLLEAVRTPEWPPDLPLVFVGDGAMRPAIDRAASELPRRVLYLGRLPYAEVATVAAHAAMSFVPMAAPERETMFSPLKLYESMSCGVPVIASDVVGISEVVDGCRCGVLVQPDDPAALACATARLLADPELAADMGRRGREAVLERYSWAARARQRLAVVESAISRADDKGSRSPSRR
jgi:glycosyltransferase involved in cell wall biosynthesis